MNLLLLSMMRKLGVSFDGIDSAIIAVEKRGFGGSSEA